MQHGLFLPGFEVIPCELKPGQTQLTRQVYSEEARPLSETYLNPDRPWKSVYASDLAGLVKPDDYLEPRRQIKQAEPPLEKGCHRGTSHWRSEYRSAMSRAAVEGARYHRQDGPCYQADNPPSCVSGMGATSSYAQDFGKFGSNPRDRMRPEDDTMPVVTNELTEGTTKGTCHIPGYQGFIPSNTNGEAAARVAKGEQMRSVDKTNIAEVFHLNLIGYSGHVPVGARNSKYCERKPSRLTVTGRDFAPLRISVLA